MRIHILLTVGLMVGACAADDDRIPSKDDVRTGAVTAKADGIDWCEVLEWYSDGVCDDFCANPDPDCPFECNVDPRTVLCSEDTLFNSDTCACEVPAVCTANACLPGTVKNPFTCVCEPDPDGECDLNPVTILCAPGRLFNPETCACEPVEDECDVDPATVLCSENTLFNPDSCACEEPAVCIDIACPAGTSKNPFTCVCE